MTMKGIDISKWQSTNTGLNSLKSVEITKGAKTMDEEIKEVIELTEEGEQELSNGYDPKEELSNGKEEEKKEGK